LVMRCFGCMAELHDGVETCPLCGYRGENEASGAQFLAPGTLLADRYLIGRTLGSGGFGVTYLAWDESLGRKVAIKEYFPSNLSTRISGRREITAFSGEKEQIFLHGLQRFQEEARVLMRFTGYDGIVSVYDVLEANGTAYIVMEYLEGVTLGQRVKREGPMEEEALLSCVVPMLLSLKFVHQQGYIHRDISPDNIMCLPDGTVKLLDFGAARYAVMEESQSLSVIIKQGFAPVEQYQSHGEQGPWTDIYAVGATMYSALTGVTPEESLERLASDTLKPPAQLRAGVTAPVESAIMTALNLRGEDRPQDLDAFLAILTGQEEGNVVRTKKKAFSPRWIAVIVLAIIGIVGITAGLAHLANRTDDSVEETPGIVDVPNVIRKTVDEASVLLEKVTLSLRIDNGRYFDKEMVKAGYIQLGQIMTQDPEGGKPAEEGTAVGVEISKGKEQERVPDVTAMTAENALAYIEKAGFDESLTVETETVPSETNMPGTVVSQSVPGDSSLDFDGTLHLQISSGPERPPVSAAAMTTGDYVGEDFAAVKAALLQDGVYLVKSDAVYSSDFPAGTIIEQYPAPGTEIHGGGAIYAAVSLGPEYAYVPDLLYLSAGEAKQVLAESGLSWKLEYVIDSLVALDHVTGQETEPGTPVPFGTQIALTVSGESEYTELPLREDIAFPDEALFVEVGESGQLDCLYDGDQPLIWASSNPMIVSVTQEGVFTAERFGTATISISVGGNVAVCAISVSAPGRIIAPAAYQLETGEQVSLVEHVPEDIRASVVWRTSNAGAAAVDQNGVVTAAAEGYTCVQACYRDRVTAFDVFVMGREEYVEIPKSTLTGSGEQAEKALRARGIPSTVQQEFSASKASGMVTRIRYQGYSDEEKYYIQRDSSVTVYVSAGKNQVASIAVKTPPAKMSYRAGERPDYSGLALTVTYADGSVRTVASGYTAPSEALRSVPSQAVTIGYEGKSTSLTFTVTQERSLDIQSLPKKTAYTVGEKLDTAGLVLSYTDSSGKITEVASGFQASGSTSAAGRQRVTVTYQGLSVTYAITVEEARTASLTIKTKPNATSCYVGDPLDTTGLTLDYTRTDGKTANVKTGFQAACDTSRAGQQTVTVWYKDLTVTYDLTVKAPSVTVHRAEQEGGILLYAQTDPVGQSLTWSSSNEAILYHDGSNFVVHGSGKVRVTASMVYNGIEYSDSCEVSVEGEPVRYAFKVCPADGESGSAAFAVESDIPGFDPNGVHWSISDTSLEAWQEKGLFHVAEGRWKSFTVTASYIYSGASYTDSYYNEAAEQVTYYSFQLTGLHSDGRGVYVIQSDIPGFSLSQVEWTVSTGYGGWLEGDRFIVDEAAMEEGDSYTIAAQYDYNGVSYLQHSTYVCPAKLVIDPFDGEDFPDFQMQMS